MCGKLGRARSVITTVRIPNEKFDANGNKTKVSKDLFVAEIS